MRQLMLALICSCFCLSCGDGDKSEVSTDANMSAATSDMGPGGEVGDDTAATADMMESGTPDASIDAGSDSGFVPDMTEPSTGPCEFNDIDPTHEQHVTWNGSWLNYVGLSADPAAEGTFDSLAIVIYEQEGGTIGPTTVALGPTTWDHTLLFASAECEAVGEFCRRFLAITGTLEIQAAGKNLGDPFDASVHNVVMREYTVIDNQIEWVEPGGTFCVDGVQLFGGTLPI